MPTVTRKKKRAPRVNSATAPMAELEPIGQAYSIVFQHQGKRYAATFTVDAGIVTVHWIPPVLGLSVLPQPPLPPAVRERVRREVQGFVTAFRLGSGHDADISHEMDHALIAPM